MRSPGVSAPGALLRLLPLHVADASAPLPAAGATAPGPPCEQALRATLLPKSEDHRSLPCENPRRDSEFFPQAQNVLCKKNLRHQLQKNSLEAFGGQGLPRQGGPFCLTPAARAGVSAVGSWAPPVASLHLVPATRPLLTFPPTDSDAMSISWMKSGDRHSFPSLGESAMLSGRRKAGSLTLGPRGVGGQALLPAPEPQSEKGKQP